MSEALGTGRGGSPRLRFGSVCSGIEAASVAWHPLGWETAWVSEIDPFASAVLAHRFPTVPNLGDFTRISDATSHLLATPVDVLVGGTPCQSFSVAGLRQGLRDARGGLTLEFVRLVEHLRPRWVVWENVPGVLSQDGGRAFGTLIGALEECGYGWAYRVVDAQYARVDGFPRAVPQRRKRVLLVGHSGGSGERAASVLLEPESSGGVPPSRRPNQPGDPCTLAGGFEVCGALSDGAHQGGGLNGQDLYYGRIQPIETSSGLRARRLLPVEAERLQGFPDGWTDIPYRGKASPPEGLRFRALGNTMAVNVMRWIGTRIDLVDAAYGGST
jgi:site-specific DNA-cytosine methylase